MLIRNLTVGPRHRTQPHHPLRTGHHPGPDLNQIHITGHRSLHLTAHSRPQEFIIFGGYACLMARCNHSICVQNGHTSGECVYFCGSFNLNSIIWKILHRFIHPYFQSLLYPFVSSILVPFLFFWPPNQSLQLPFS